MTDWTFDELNSWDKKICDIAEKYGLDWYDIDYEIIDYYDMIGNIVYTGMPSHYKHWSLGKEFEKKHHMYNAGLEGLPYEMIINSDPSIAYLMRENPMPMHVLTMAHCIGHSDFFKNNITFRSTDPKNVIRRFKKAGDRVRKYVEDPSIGIDKVEKVLDAAHSIKYQCDRYLNIKRLGHEELKERYVNKIKNDSEGTYVDFDINKMPLEPDYNILAFIRDHGRNLEEWEKDLISIVIQETNYFIPQAQTKIMNEGWASFWHYKILNELDLPQDFHLSFLKSHNQVIRPLVGRLNPYFAGFKIFERLEKEAGLGECFLVREIMNDESFIREYLDKEMCEELNLFSYSLKTKKNAYTVDDISDDEGWKKIRDALISNVALNGVPKVYVEEVDRGDFTLNLRHEHDGRDLDLEYAEMVTNHIRQLWRDPVKLWTVFEDGDDWEL